MDCNYTVNKILFDYWSFTVKNSTPEDIISLLGLDGITFIDTYGSKGYQHRYYYDGVSIMFGGRDEIWCEMTGQGCRVYESYGNNDWYGLAYQILENEYSHMTRLDVAYDDFNGLLDLDAILEDVKSGSWVAKCKKIHNQEDYGHLGINGHCIMCGERGSSIACRIYDKAQERNRADEINHWVRCELQIRHKHADNFLYYLLADDVNSIYGIEIDNNRRLDALYFAVLTHFVRFIDLDANSDSNLWRKPLSKHWEKFVSSYHGNKISLYSAPGVDYNILKFCYTVEEQYGAMIYTYIEIFGIDELENVVKPKQFKLNKKYQSIIESERLRKEASNGT